MCEYGDTTTWVPTGWKCPVCKRIYSPSTTMCLYCGGEQKAIVSATGTTVDWTPHTTVTGIGPNSVVLKDGEKDD